MRVSLLISKYLYPGKTVENHGWEFNSREQWLSKPDVVQRPGSWGQWDYLLLIGKLIIQWPIIDSGMDPAWSGGGGGGALVPTAELCRSCVPNCNCCSQFTYHHVITQITVSHFVFFALSWKIAPPLHPLWPGLQYSSVNRLLLLQSINEPVN